MRQAAPPLRLGPETSAWPGNYKVGPVDLTWQRIVFSRADVFVDTEFDGVCLDQVDACAKFEGAT
jgi:uncharacterized protein (TIGR01370 family)